MDFNCISKDITFHKYKFYWYLQRASRPFQLPPKRTRCDLLQPTMLFPWTLHPSTVSMSLRCTDSTPCSGERFSALGSHVQDSTSHSSWRTLSSASNLRMHISMVFLRGAPCAFLKSFWIAASSGVCKRIINTWDAGAQSPHFIISRY